MIVKKIYNGDDARDRLISGVRKLSGAVKSTLGPGGRSVIMESEHHASGKTITKDGVTVANAINLYDPVENLGVQIVREAAQNTVKTSGDGTSSSIVLTEAIIDAFMSNVNGEDKTKVLRSLRVASEEVVSYLKSKIVKDFEIRNIAMVSSNGNEEVANVIAEIYKTSNFVTVADSQTPETYSEEKGGINIDRGWSSQYYVNDVKTNQCILENCYILFTDQVIQSLNQIEKILVQVMNEGKSLLIVGQLSERAAHTLNANVSRGVIKACHVIPPAHGWRMNELMTDLSKVFGATYFSMNSGDQLDLVEITDLALVDKVVVGESKTSIFTALDTNDYINSIKEVATDKEFLKQRVANLSGSATTIYVGAVTDIERKGKRDVYDDVVCAVNAALEDGVLPGGGVSLFHAASDIEFEDELIDVIMFKSLTTLFDQLVLNTGTDVIDVMEMIGIDFYDGVDLRTFKAGNMLEMGIIDPARVTIDVVRNAFSVALTILDSDVIIVNQRQDESDR